MLPLLVGTSRIGLCQRTFLNILSRSYSPTVVPMPALSPTMEDGTVVKWLMSEGEKVDVGDGLCEVETDKAVVTVESVDEGILGKILIPEGTRNVKINVPIAVIADDEEDVNEIKNMSFATPEQRVPVEALSTNQHQKQNPGSLLPSVRLYIQQYDIDASSVVGTGPKGRILKGDILQIINDNQLVPLNLLEVANSPLPISNEELVKPYLPPVTEQHTADSSEDKIQDKISADVEKEVQPSDLSKPSPESLLHTDNDVSNIRNVIAKRLCQSKQSIPHNYTSMECSLDKIIKLRKDFLSRGVKLSLNDFIVKAAAMALQEEPNINSIWKHDALCTLPESDISVAVATESGLITPIIKSAQKKGLSQISDETRELANKARKGQLRPEEFTGGTFTISNLGMFDINHFTAIINPPQTSIMAVGGSKIKFSQSPESDGFTPETVVTVTLSSDARAIDSHIALNFLTKFKQKMENPMSLGLM